MASFSVIIAAAGQSSRFQDQNYKKPFIPLAGKAVWLHSAEKFLKRDDVKQVIVVISPEDREMFQMKFGANIAILGIDAVDGGSERCESVQNALNVVRDEMEYVAVHDAARPCFADEWIDRVFDEATKSGAAIPATPVVGTVKKSASGKTIDQTVDRTHLWIAQTPQVFRKDILLSAYAKRANQVFTDEAQAVEASGHPVSIVTGSSLNLKITTKEDLKLAEQVLKVMPKPNLSGPAHPFADDDLWR